jgi:dynein heavy chain
MRLSQQHSYGWGMRVMKAVVGNAARAKLRNCDEHEGVQIIASVLACTAPQLMSAKAAFFEGLIADVFPDLCAAGARNKTLSAELSAPRSQFNEELFKVLIHKALDLYETHQIRPGVILVRAAMNNTTTVWREGEIASNADQKHSSLDG